MLVNKLTGRVGDQDLIAAKEILRRKCLVGLMEKMEETVSRIDRYFGFDDDDTGGRRKCMDNMLHDRGIDGTGKGSNRHQHVKVERGSEEWEALAEAHNLDMQLFDYALGLFEVQGALLENLGDSI